MARLARSLSSACQITRRTRFYRSPGKTGQVSPQPIVTRTSLAQTASSVRTLGISAEMSHGFGSMPRARSMVWSSAEVSASSPSGVESATTSAPA